jgi:hypothetical protein
MSVALIVAIVSVTALVVVAVSAVWQRTRVVLVIEPPRRPPQLPPSE